MPSGYHHNCFVATHALGQMMHGYTLLVPKDQRVLNRLSKERNISGHKWSITHRVLKSHRSRIGVLYMQFLLLFLTPIFLLWDLSTLCVVDHLWPLIYMYIHKGKAIIEYIRLSNILSKPYVLVQLPRELQNEENRPL